MKETQRDYRECARKTGKRTGDVPQPVSEPGQPENLLCEKPAISDSDVLTRLRKLEADMAALKHRLAESERRDKRAHDAPAYKRDRLIWPLPRLERPEPSKGSDPDA